MKEYYSHCTHCASLNSKISSQDMICQLVPLMVIFFIIVIVGYIKFQKYVKRQRAREVRIMKEWEETGFYPLDEPLDY